MSSLNISRKQFAFYVLSLVCRNLGYFLTLKEERSIDWRSTEYHGDNFTLELSDPDHNYEFQFDGKETMVVIVDGCPLDLSFDECAEFLPLIKQAYFYDKPVVKKARGNVYCGA
jgi:hypothetical protein